MITSQLRAQLDSTKSQWIRKVTSWLDRRLSWGNFSWTSNSRWTVLILGCFKRLDLFRDTTLIRFSSTRKPSDSTWVKWKRFWLWGRTSGTQLSTRMTKWRARCKTWQLSFLNCEWEMTNKWRKFRGWRQKFTKCKTLTKFISRLTCCKGANKGSRHSKNAFTSCLRGWLWRENMQKS